MNARRLRFACLLVTAAALVACGGQSEQELTESGLALMAKKDTKGAVIQFKSALQKNPQSATARLQLGRALLASKDPVSALVELRKAQELQAPDDQVAPDLARAMLMLGEETKLIAQLGKLQLKDAQASADLQTSLGAAYAVQGDAEKSEQAIQAALQAVPMYAPALTLQARTKAVDGDYDGALVLLGEVLAKEPGNEPAGVLKGQVLWRGKNDPKAAIAAYRQVLSAQADSLPAQTALITLLQGQGEIEPAKAQLEHLKKVAPHHPDTLFLEAQFAFAAKDYKTTREITSRLLKGMPESARVLELAGAAEYRMKNYTQAEAHLGLALKHAPGMLLSRQLLAQTYLRSHQPHKAIDVLGPVINGKQPDGTSLALAGEAWLQAGDDKKAEAAFKRATQAAPTDARVRTSAAMAHVARGGGGAAMSELEAVAAGDTGTRADLALISARLKSNDIPGALKAIDALQRKQPDRPLAYNLRGRVQLLARDVPAAVKSFEAALAKDANYFPAIASLAAIELNAGKPDAARKRFEDAIKAQPTNTRARLALAELTLRTGGTSQQARQIIQDAVKANPGEATPRLALINHLLVVGDAPAALVAAQEASAALPSDLAVMEALGRAQMASGNGQQAVSTFKQLASLQPTQAMHQVQLADAYTLNKDIAEATRAIRRALEIQPDLTTAKRALVALALMDKRPQDAVTLARELQKKDPKDPVGFALEGDVEASRKAWDAAAAAYRGAMQRGGGAETAVKLHGALRAAGKAADAERVATEWRKGHPTDPVFPYYLGDLALARNDFAGAEALYHAVLEVQPANALAMNNIAWLMVKQGKPGAVAMAERAVALLPDRAAVLDTLAFAQAAENQLPQAIETQKRAIARNPQDAALKLTLARYLVKAGNKAHARAELEALAKLGDKFAGQAEVSALLKTL